MASHVVVSDSSGGKAIHISALRRKSSSKAMGSIGTLLVIGLADLIFADRSVDRRQRHQALRNGIDLFNGVLGAESLLVGGQGARISIFGGGSRTFLVDVCNCLGAKNLRGAFGQSCQRERLRSQ